MKLLGASRIALGTLFLVRTTMLANLLPIPLARVRGLLYGWPEPGWAMAWGGLVLPPSVRILASIVRTIAALCFVLGVRARIAGVVAGGLGLLAMQQDPFGFIFTLYTLFVGTIVLASTDATSELALRPDSSLDRHSSAALVRLVCASVYVWAALAKLHVQWLRGETLLTLARDGILRMPVAGILRSHDGLRLAAAWSTVAAELAIGIALALGATKRISRARQWAIAGAVVMHATFEVAARPDVIGLVMISLLLACASSARNSTSSEDERAEASPSRGVVI